LNLLYQLFGRAHILSYAEW